MKLKVDEERQKKEEKREKRTAKFKSADCARKDIIMEPFNRHQLSVLYLCVDTLLRRTIPTNFSPCNRARKKYIYLIFRSCELFSSLSRFLSKRRNKRQKRNVEKREENEKYTECGLGKGKTQQNDFSCCLHLRGQCWCVGARACVVTVCIFFFSLQIDVDLQLKGSIYAILHFTVWFVCLCLCFFVLCLVPFSRYKVLSARRDFHSTSRERMKATNDRQGVSVCESEKKKKKERKNVDKSRPYICHIGHTMAAEVVYFVTLDVYILIAKRLWRPKIHNNVGPQE